MAPKCYNYQYYQSESHMVIEILGVRNVPQENIVVEIQRDMCKVVINTPGFDAFTKNFNLFRPINPEASTYKIYTSKVEMRLAKEEPSNWLSLEKTGERILPTPSAPSSSPSTSSANMFSTSHWDSFCRENEEAVDTSGDKLFKVLYQGASPDQRRAMMKSMQQSNGKVLNMNWDEVKDNNYDEEGKD